MGAVNREDGIIFFLPAEQRHCGRTKHHNLDQGIRHSGALLARNATEQEESIHVRFVVLL